MLLAKGRVQKSSQLYLTIMAGDQWSTFFETIHFFITDIVVLNDSILDKLAVAVGIILILF